MHSTYVRKRKAIYRITILVVSLAIIGSLTCRADQLQWNALRVCEAATRAIGRQSLLISYCSQANEDYVELWLVRGAYVVDTPAEGLFEVFVLAKRLYRSRKPFSSGEFPVPVDHWNFDKVRDAGWFVEGIDLAYAYIHAGDSSFQCLGKVLGLKCLVGVKTIGIPRDVIEKLIPQKSPSYPISLQSFDLLPA